MLISIELVDFDGTSSSLKFYVQDTVSSYKNFLYDTIITDTTCQNERNMLNVDNNYNLFDFFLFLGDQDGEGLDHIEKKKKTFQK